MREKHVVKDLDRSGGRWRNMTYIDSNPAELLLEERHHPVWDCVVDFTKVTCLWPLFRETE
jgi:hypothetical protein